MIARRRGQEPRVGRLRAATPTGLFDHLESRRLLAKASGVCACGHCVLCGMSSEEALERLASPTLVPLASVSAKNKSLRGTGFELFNKVNSVAKPRGQSLTHVNAVQFAPFTIDMDDLKTRLAAAPLEFSAAARSPLVLALPTPEGTFARFQVVEAPIMEKALAEEFPEIKTYRGIGIDDPTAALRLDYTPLGFHAQVLNEDETFYIDPYYLNDANGSYLSYYRQNLVRTDSFQCMCDAEGLLSSPASDVLEVEDALSDDAPLSLTFGGTLKTYRAAVGASYQYTAAVGGGTVAGGQAAIVTAMNRVTGVYETELSIRMTLVANNSSLVYATSTNSFSNSSSVINTSTSKISGIIGAANYDIGHVFTTGSGGVAYLGVVGNNSFKGGGTTGLPNPTGDAFYIDYVAHEIGHQFGANHTFNTANDTGNRNAGTAYEPGSGVTIMGYAGLEGNDDLALSSIPYFHAASLDEIRNYIATVPLVGTSTATGNTAPTVSAGLDYVIPTGTHFALTANGSDPDGHALTYDWQQMDLGPATFLNTADNGSSPLFRPFAPSSSPTRVFPILSRILVGGTTSGNYAGNNTYAAERLPTVARSAMKFRVIARDNRVGGGGVATDDMQIQVVNTGSAFTITNLNSSTTLAGGSFQTINWNVAGTTGNGINVANVKISLSLTSGLSFPLVLSESTANDGSETVQIPYGIGATTARIKVEAVGNIFFDINNAALTVTNVPVPSSATPDQPVLLSDTGLNPSDALTNKNNSDPGSVLDFQIGGTVAGALVELLIDGTVVGTATAVGTSTIVTTDGTFTLADGPHSFTARQTEAGKPVSNLSTAGTFTIDTAAPALAGTPVFHFETGHSIKYVFAESDVGNFSATAITVSDGTNTIPATVSYDSGTMVTTITFGGLLADGNYTATLDGASITDAAGNALVTGSPLSFFVLAGDLNRDRTVDFSDVLIVAQNYGSTGSTYSTGNANYDPTGEVGFDDLLLIVQTYGNGMPALQGARVGVAPGVGSAPGTRRRIAESVL